MISFSLQSESDWHWKQVHQKFCEVWSNNTGISQGDTKFWQSINVGDSYQHYNLMTIWLSEWTSELQMYSPHLEVLVSIEKKKLYNVNIGTVEPDNHKEIQPL